MKEFGVFDVTINKIDKFKDEIETNANLDKMREILEYLTLNDEISNKVNIVNSFGESALISILLYGVVEHIRSKYIFQIDRYGHVLGIFLDTPAFWINNIAKSGRKRKKQGPKSPKERGPVLYTVAHESSVEDMLLNEEFLRNKGFDVSVTEEINVKTLKTRHVTIKDNYDIFKSYGIIDENNIGKFWISSLTFSNVLEHLDNLVEVGLLDDYIETERVQGAYASMHSSAIQNMTPEKFMFLYKLKASMSLDEYYDLIFSKSKGGMLANTTINTMMKNEGLSASTNDKYFSNYFVELENRIPNYDEYLECLYKSDIVTYNESILNDQLIIELENNYKDTRYSYIFGNQTISRLKVLRNFTILRNNGYINEDALLFCITYNSYINEETFNIIRGSLKLNGGSR